MANDNVYLTFGSQSGTPATYRATIVNYTQGFTSQMNTATLRSQKNNYPIRVKENDLQFSIQCKSVKEYDILKAAVRKTHKAALVNASQGICRFKWPKLKLDYLGYILQSPEGVARFDYSPMLPLTMVLIKDNINTVTSYSYQSVDWKQIYGTNIADLYEKADTSAFDYADGTMANNQPPVPANSTGAGSSNSAENDQKLIDNGGSSANAAEHDSPGSTSNIPQPTTTK